MTYYILDARTVVGNCALWWRANGQGYTCDLADAGVYDENTLPHGRDTDIPVPIDVAQRIAVVHVRLDTPELQAIIRRYAREDVRLECGA